MRLPSYLPVVALAASTVLCSPVASFAQDAESRWNAEVSVGWDIGLSGDFLSAGIGTLEGVPVVFQSQPFDQVYGNGVVWSFSGGYMVDDIN